MCNNFIYCSKNVEQCCSNLLDRLEHVSILVQLHYILMTCINFHYMYTANWYIAQHLVNIELQKFTTGGINTFALHNYYINTWTASKWFPTSCAWKFSNTISNCNCWHAASLLCNFRSTSVVPTARVVYLFWDQKS